MPPLIKLYLDEINQLYKHNHFLAIILVCGVASELYARELNQDVKIGYEKLLIILRNEKTITIEEHSILDRIRMLRNKYIHISADKVIESTGLANSDKVGTVTFIEETVNDELTEKSLLDLYGLRLVSDAEEIYTLTTGLLKDAFVKNRNSHK